MEEAESDFYSLLVDSEAKKTHIKKPSADLEKFSKEEEIDETVVVEDIGGSDDEEEIKPKTLPAVPPKSVKEAELLQVATVTMKMRQFWINLIEEKTNETKPIPKLEHHPIKLDPRTKFSQEPKAKSQISFPAAGNVTQLKKSLKIGRALSSGNLQEFMETPKSSKDVKGMGLRVSASEVSPEAIKDATKLGSSPKGDSFLGKIRVDSPPERRKSIFGGKSEKKLYIFKEKTLKRMDWSKIKNDYTTNFSNVLISAPTQGYFVELGNAFANKVWDVQTFSLEDTDKYECYYRNHFIQKEHLNYFGLTEKKEFAIISISQKEESSDERYFFRAIIRVPEADKRIDLVRQVKDNSAKISKKSLVKELKAAFSHISKAKLIPVDNFQLQQDLVTYESRQVVVGIKIGVLLRKEGQMQEEEMFSTNEPTPLFTEFLEFLGDRINLKGFTGFRGGLDVKTDSTGTESIFTKLKDIEIMFHVSTMLPYSEADKQQLERKRHIGNDIVVIIFNESSTPFSVQTITSEFNHVWAVVQPIEDPSGTLYKVAFAAKPGVPPFGPLLPEPSVFQKNDQFRNFFLTKLLNAERAACASPNFLSKITRTRKELLQSIANKYLPPKRLK